MVNYHNIDSKILEFDLNSVELKFGLWITKKEFGQRLNTAKPLPKGQFYMSIRVVAKDIEVSEMIARRLIKQFTKLDIIRLIAISNSPKEGSIYEYLVQCEDNTVENIVGTRLRHSKSEEISHFGGGRQHGKNVVGNIVYNASKNKNKIKENNIYIDLKFIDQIIENVKITDKQYERLKDNFGTELLHNQILALDNYIVNGKGNKYKDHYRVLNTWCNNNKVSDKTNINTVAAYEEFKFDF